VLMFHLSVSVSFLFHYLTGVLLRGCVDATIYDEYEINEGIVLIVQTILCALFVICELDITIHSQSNDFEIIPCHQPTQWVIVYTSRTC
jgi:hypothetical protein